MTKFKVGDLVYFTSKSNKVLTVKDGINLEYPLTVGGYHFTCDGKYLGDEPVPSLLHATHKNHALLEQLYGVEFEKPPVKPTSREIVQAMLVRGDKSVPCWARDFNTNPKRRHEWVYICSIDDYGYFFDRNGIAWKYVTPFNPRTCEEITELPE